MLMRMLLFALMISIVACDGTAGADTAEEAVKITNRYWAESLPQVNLKNLSVKTEDAGNRWRVTYAPPEGSTGGPSVFEVDKKSGKIVHATGGQ
jgi:hypothetical protein